MTLIRIGSISMRCSLSGILLRNGSDFAQETEIYADMVDITLEDIFTNENIEEALDDLAGKKDVCGPDGLSLSQLPHYWEVNGKKIRETLFTGRFRPGTVQNIEIVNRNGKKRKISVMNGIDRLILRCIAQIMQPACDFMLSDNCYAFREGKGTTAAAVKASDFIESGCKWVVKIDIKDYYDSIPMSGLQSLLARTLRDVRLVTLLQRYLTVKVEDEGRVKRRRKGILTGSPISPLIANLYLAPLDDVFTEPEYRYCRYADDIALFCYKYEDAEEYYARLQQILDEVYGLKINENKSGIRKAIQETYLGYQFEREPASGIVTAVRHRHESQTVYRNWEREGVQLIDRNYHLINDGVLTKKDYTLLFDNEDGKKYIPVETTDSITIYSNVIFAGDVLKFLSSKNIYLTIVDKYGEVVGYYNSPGISSRSRTMMKQAAVYLDEQQRLSIAKSMEVAFIHNMNANLKYYGRRNKSEKIRRWTETFPKVRDEINGVNEVSKLMLIEARCRQEYYDLMNEIIRTPGYEFTARTRRPPKDPLNAMLSFGNTLLYNRIAMEINKTTLDIRIGIVHSTTNRSQSLNLDVADLFKPILVDRTIFTLINRKVLDLNRDFVTNEDGSVYLTTIGKRIFISEFNSKLYQKLTENGKSISYDTKIKQEIQKLYRFFVKGEKYKPFKYIN